LIGFLQRVFGYCLTGVTDARVFFVAYGQGHNGKTVTQETLAEIMGDYALRVSTETLMIKRDGSHPCEIAQLEGARFIYCSEAEEGQRLAESRIKDLTGGDKMAGRHLYKEWRQFDSTGKIWLATNHKPGIRGTDEAIWGRIKLIPFTVVIPPEERIPKSLLMETFMKEAPGILNWAVHGCRKWQETGLDVSKEVKAATEAYRREMDILGDFLSQCCVFEENAEIQAGVLHLAYSRWAEQNKEKSISQRELGVRLRERGFRDDKRGGKYFWQEIGLKDGG